MKKFVWALAALLMLATGLAFAEENLIVNGDFSQLDGALPLGWRKELWLTDAGISLLEVIDDGWEGRGISVQNVDPNDARFVQTVDVEPDSVYRLSGRVWAEDCDEASYGATLSIGGVFVYSESKYDTAGRWDYVELYGRTGPKQTTLDVFCRVGGYSNLGTGSARFDDIALVKLDKAPAGASVYDFFTDDAPAAAAEPADPEEPKRYTEAWLLFAGVYAFLAAGLLRKRQRSLDCNDEKAVRRRLWAVLGLALIIRLAVSLRVPGYNTDINCFTAWSERMFAMGPFKFYAPDYFCDYPPGYMLLLWPVGLIRKLFNLSTAGAVYRMILKLLPMLADVAGAWLIYRVARKRMAEGLALTLAALYALNPAAICNSAAWGQIDALLTLLIALCALSAGEGRYFRALMWFTAALLIKPQALLFAPLGLLAVIVGIAASEDRAGALKSFLLGTAACLGILYVAGVAASASQAGSFGEALGGAVGWMVNQYSGAMQGYRYMTINTLNLYCLMGLNWANVEGHAGMFALAWVLFALAYLYTTGLCAASRKKPLRLLLLGGVLIMLISAFGPMMHERYVFPALLLLSLAFAVDRDVRVLVSLIALTVTLFLNEVLVLQGGMTAANYGHLQSSEDWLNGLLSLMTVLNALFIAWTAWDICLRGHLVPLRAVAAEAEPMGAATLKHPEGYRLNLRRADIIVMAAVTLAYSVLAFTNLGVTKAPQTGWTSSVSGESVVFDLGETRTFRMTYYGGICNSNFRVSLSNDGTYWTPECWAKYNQGEIFRWLWFTPLDEADNTLYAEDVDQPDDAPVRLNTANMAEANPRQTARYVRITAESAGLNLFEVAFLDEEGVPFPIAGVEQLGQTAQSDSDAANLVDEQDTAPPIPTYLNSTYFDEIYHARTAYEHLHGMPTYETTHPPLGKVWMMLGVWIFGMTPFGWRFMGVLAGVMMLPVMYLLVRQLTRDSRLSAIAMLLLALDSMHFTQTRIATIDSYAVFWIMLEYLFMFRYCRMSWNHQPLKKTLVPLGLCGVTMGLACATKWIGIYAAAGLAILFFWTLFNRLREYPHIRGDNPTVKNTVVTLAFCVAFFVIIPLVIYYFSYYWYLRAEGLSGFGGMFSLRWVKRVAEIQKNMFNYHAGLGGDTHYFRSPWYQWPVIWWPMWYYSGTGFMPEGTISSISCMGNPAVWWFGLGALIYVFARACLDRRADRAKVMTVIGFASQFLPWVLVPRSTFIYHYFASVPFIIIASALALKDLRARSPKAYQAVSCVLLAAAAALFAMFYPLESGLPCPRSYARYLRWFKWYNY